VGCASLHPPYLKLRSSHVFIIGRSQEHVLLSTESVTSN
jgi:hypothetical protein